MDRRSFLKLAGLSLAATLQTNPARAASSGRPNILMIYADDMGYGDLSCYGGKLVPTPNIDRFAAVGVRCTDGYVTMAVCGPSRCGLMTGSYQQRFGIQENEDRNSATHVIPPEHKLMPEALKAAGYTTGHIGKWNVKRDPKLVFDEVHSLIDWAADYFPQPDGHYIGVDREDEHDAGHVYGWREPREGEEYLTDRLGRQATEFIEKHKARPWFLYLAFNAAHGPWQVEARYKERLAEIPEPLREYAAMIIELDKNVGRVMDKLREAGLEENTVVAFVSDNGPARANPGFTGWLKEWPQHSVLMGSAGPLRGNKRQFWEGGIREPFILRWPAMLKAGQVCSQPVMTMDLYPTFCAAAGAPIPAGTKLDGVDLLPFLTGERSGAPHEKLFWKSGPAGAVREGDWKLLVGYAPQPQLFNLKADIGEQKDLAAEKPELAKRLFGEWKTWGDALPPTASTALKAAKAKKNKAKSAKKAKKTTSPTTQEVRP